MTAATRTGDKGMAGRRRAVAGRRTTKPTRAVGKHERRVRDFAEGLGRSREPRERIAEACDIIRRALGDMPPATAERITAQVVDAARSAIREADPSRVREGSRR